MPVGEGKTGGAAVAMGRKILPDIIIQFSKNILRRRGTQVKPRSSLPRGG
jgi:hypothetical protein